LNGEHDFMSASPARTPLRHKLLLSASLLVGLPLFAEVAARVWLATHVPGEPPRLTEQIHCEYDAQLGWRNLPNVSRPDIYGKGLSLTTNGRGFRALEEHATEIPAGRYRVVCLGDSFTMGYGVDDLATYPACLQRLCPELQAVNMGLGGYGLDQDYLWYLADGTALDTDVLLFAFIDADLNRLGMDAFGGFSKPRIDVQGDELVVLNVPVPRGWTTRDQAPPAGAGFVESLALWRLGHPPAARAGPAIPVAKTEEEFAHTLSVAARLFDELAELSAARGQRFVLMYLPTGPLAGNAPTPVALWAREYSASSGTPLVDMGAAFQAMPREDIARNYLPDRHLSAAGNEFVARTLIAELSRMIDGFPACDG